MPAAAKESFMTDAEFHWDVVRALHDIGHGAAVMSRS